MRVVIDCNVVVSAARSGGACAKVIVEAARNHEIVLSDPILDEYLTIAHRPKHTHYRENLLAIIKEIKKVAIVVEPAKTVFGLHDPDDEVYLATAIAGRAAALVTGNTRDFSFRNIRHLPPCASDELAREFKRSDIFITASRHDPCSNSLVEALHCGLPAIARRDGGHPEVLGSGGELFDAMEEVPELIERLVAGHAGYAGRIEAPSIDEVAGRYAAFAESLAGEVEAGHLMTKRPSFLQGLFFGG